METQKYPLGTYVIMTNSKNKDQKGHIRYFGLVI